MRAVIFLATFCLLTPTAFAATISGTIYDFTLQPVKDGRLTVNTTPTQFLVAADGTYSFEVANGDYHLRAERYDGSTLVAFEEKNFSVKRPGDYVVDFIVFPDFDIEQELTQDLEQDFSEVDADPEQKSLLWIIIFLLMMLIGIVLYFFVGGKTEPNSKEPITKEKPIMENPIEKNSLKKDQKEKITESNDLESSSIIIDILKKHGGRATQKDIRKDIPLSEAKISLMIAELEHQGKIEKIKKGRGNIIVLK